MNSQMERSLHLQWTTKNTKRVDENAKRDLKTLSPPWTHERWESLGSEILIFFKKSVEEIIQVYKY
jgi:hypothetical protein